MKKEEGGKRNIGKRVTMRRYEPGRRKERVWKEKGESMEGGNSKEGENKEERNSEGEETREKEISKEGWNIKRKKSKEGKIESN